MVQTPLSGDASFSSTVGYGPVFLLEPPAQLTFSNTSGSQVSCSAHGSPDPQVDWLLQDGQTVTSVPGLRERPVDARSGSGNAFAEI
ncbi:hypothetical protein NQ317_017932 [Molorchus minor]|uniref:Ig-like domain-containing protein n=1 Tax=Molorchus minor TaxID=1323400 RepID=A0ABQ9JS23_9CUCU|nr:hypothetical protein NQ317_017932 [Molorchus minor]